MNDYPIAANAETIRLITFSAWCLDEAGGFELQHSRGNAACHWLYALYTWLYRSGVVGVAGSTS